jgi:hypothetical protein
MIVQQVDRFQDGLPLGGYLHPGIPEFLADLFTA